MREIKFRAFNKTTGEMSEPFTIEDLLRVEVPLLSRSSIADEIIWIEFTGLKDKNGKEIYEGDIIRNTTDGECCEVKYIENGFWLQQKNDPEGMLSLPFGEYREVIGNIYENPELLEGK